MARPAFRTCGVRIDALSPEQAVDAVLAAVRDEHAAAVHLCNAYTLSLAVRDPDYARLLDRAELNLMDGMPLVWLARWLGYRHCSERVYGPDLMLALVDRGRNHDLGHYLYGGAPEVVTALARRLEHDFPGAQVVGAESPPFRDLTAAEQEEAAARIEASGADLVWVGLGTPRQDVVVDRLRDRLNTPVLAVGAAFDFHAGAKRQAPAFLQRAGLEWLFRLLTEPRRLWRRYLIGNPVFLYGLTRGVTRSIHPRRQDEQG